MADIIGSADIMGGEWEDDGSGYDGDDGSGYDDESGARRPRGGAPAPRPRGGAPAPRRKGFGHQVPGGANVRTRGAVIARRLSFGLAPTTPLPLGPGATITLQGSASEPFRFENMVIGSPDLASLSVLRVDVGRYNQSVNNNPIPAVAFANNSVGTGYEGNTVQTGSQIAVLIRNDGLTPVTVLSAGVFGTSLEG